jgi:hypothetical protein
LDDAPFVAGNDAGGSNTGPLPAHSDPTIAHPIAQAKVNTPIARADQAARRMIVRTVVFGGELTNLWSRLLH